MGDSKLYTRVKASDILTELNNYEKKPKSSVYRKTILKKIIINMSVGDNEVIMLISQVTKILSDLGPTDSEIKQLCYFYLTNYWRHKQEETLHALPFIVNDYETNKKTSDNDTCLAIRTMASIHIANYLNSLVPILEESLQREISGKIRKTAAYAVAEIFNVNEKRDPESNRRLLMLLNDMLAEEDDASVVSAALSALREITDKSDTLKLSIDSNHAVKLANSLTGCGEWSQVSILSSLLSFISQDLKTAAHLIDTVLPYLQSENSSIVLNALKVVVYLSHYVDNVLDVFPVLPQSISGAVANLLLKPAEIQFLAMRNVILLLLDKPALMDLDIRMFFCQYDDLLYIKDTKLEIIFLLACQENMDMVLAELQEYALEIDVQMVRKSIRAIGNLAVKIDATSDKCVSVLADLISNSIPYVVEEVAIVARDILRKYPGKFDHLTHLLVDRVDLITEPESKTSIIWILGEYSSSISDSIYLLKKYAANMLEEPTETQLALLTAIIKAHVCQPYNKELQGLVENTLKDVTQNTNHPDLRERAYFYWRLLSAKLPNAIDIIKPRLLKLNTETDALSPDVCEELNLCIGTLASIYLRPVSQVFRHVKPDRLVDSPALVHQDLKSPQVRAKVRRSTIRSRSSTTTSQQLGNPSINRSRSSSFKLDEIVKKLSLKK
ncbi:hypothetical protein FOA43_002125 [Brettanomyces nanus]|uniref:AP complex subunit beta n=1 Tax=Eeniella nana TaxID=13502 RepID=A0A875RZ31_EENNA|nr:uncharacterized protein FOA43_002125 [Brettanomyces nanus]QPG74791.1 hypothetical protein FOA43_002125 [Brettanomyces nanus]